MAIVGMKNFYATTGVRGAFFTGLAYSFKVSQLVLIAISSVFICLSLIEASLLLFYDKPAT